MSIKNTILFYKVWLQNRCLTVYKIIFQHHTCVNKINFHSLKVCCLSVCRCDVTWHLDFPKKVTFFLQKSSPKYKSKMSRDTLANPPPPLCHLVTLSLTPPQSVTYYLNAQVLCQSFFPRIFFVVVFVVVVFAYFDLDF